MKIQFDTVKKVWFVTIDRDREEFDTAEAAEDFVAFIETTGQPQG